MYISELSNNILSLSNKYKLSKKIDEVSFIERLSNVLISMFSTKETKNNPFFDYWDLEFFERLLLLEGKCAIWFDTISNHYVISFAERVGNIDFEGNGKDLFCVTLNGISKTFKDYKNNQNVVLVWNNKGHTCDLNIKKYSNMLNETWISLKSYIVGTRFNKIYQCHDEISKHNLDKSFENIKDGKPITFSSNSIFEDETVKMISMTDVKDSDKIQYLDNHINFIERNFFNMYGLSSLGVDKIAQQNKAEITNGIMSSWVEPLSRLEERQKGFKKVKEFFGLDIPYDFSETWKNAYKKTLNDIEVGL